MISIEFIKIKEISFFSVITYIKRPNQLNMSKRQLQRQKPRVALKFSFPLTLLTQSAVFDISIAQLFSLHLGNELTSRELSQLWPKTSGIQILQRINCNRPRILSNRPLNCFFCLPLLFFLFPLPSSSSLSLSPLLLLPLLFLLPLSPPPFGLLTSSTCWNNLGTKMNLNRPASIKHTEILD